jgi:S-adenosylmethionine-diacylglycerol 3-amino-3-carboxypropyl transferase
MTKQLNDVRHDYIRYANCWEDADILLEGLDVNEEEKVLSIGSAGDNSFSILVKNPSLVVAVDINAVQLNLIELKRAAFKNLTYSQFLEFLGFTNSDQRLNYYAELKSSLNPEAVMYWDEHVDQLEQGIIYEGKFEKYFQLFKAKVLPLIHTKKRISTLFETKQEEEHRVFYTQKWNNVRWRLLFKVFFSKFVMGRFGRDPKFLNEVKVTVSEFIFKKAETHLSSTNCMGNYYLKFILTGKFGKELPHYAREENFELIKSRLDKLVTFEGLAEQACEKFGYFDAFNLSNIFEYMDESTFSTVVNGLNEMGNPKARYAYWNLMVPRSLSNVVEGMVYQKELSDRLSATDKGFFYSQFLVNKK